MTQNFPFVGTETEARDLVDALTHNCACETGYGGAITKRCAAHEMLLDEATTRRLVFERRDHRRLEHEEATDGKDQAA